MRKIKKNTSHFIVRSSRNVLVALARILAKVSERAEEAAAAEALVKAAVRNRVNIASIGSVEQQCLVGCWIQMEQAHVPRALAKWWRIKRRRRVRTGVGDCCARCR